MSEKNAESGFPESHKRPKDLKERRATIIFRELEAKTRKRRRLFGASSAFWVRDSRKKM